MSARLPDFMIIGAMKCGTSTLHEQLALRSGIFMSDPKEPNFFSDDDQYARGLPWYSSLFEGAHPDQICGESSTHYTKLPTYPHALDRLSRSGMLPRLIYIMRDPIQRLVSQYIHEWTQREVSGSLEHAIQNNERFVSYSCYARQLEPFLKAFGHENILPIFFEHMLAHPSEEIVRVCKFLGDPSPEEPHWSENLGAQNVSEERMRRSRVRDAILESPPVQAAKGLLSEAWRERLKAPWKMKKRPSLPTAPRAEIERRIDDDLSVLGKWLGLDLACANWKERVRDQRALWVSPPGASHEQ